MKLFLKCNWMLKKYSEYCTQITYESIQNTALNT